MNHVFITLKGLNLRIRNHVNIYNDFFLYGDFKKINKRMNEAIISSQNKKMNFMLFDESKRASFIYKKTNNKVKEESSEITNLYGNLNLYLTCLWLVADYSVVVKEGVQYSEVEPAIIDISSLTFYNSDLKLDFYYQDGEPPIEITHINTAKPYYKKIKDYRKSSKGTENRVLRAFSFINESRKTKSSYLRISFLVMALECILANNKGESVANTSLKTAYLMCLTNENREFDEVYKFIKKCYGIRSSYVHGTKFTEKDEEVHKTTSKELEFMMKSLINRILNNKEFKKMLDQPDNIMKNLIEKIKI